MRQVSSVAGAVFCYTHGMDILRLWVLMQEVSRMSVLLHLLEKFLWWPFTGLKPYATWETAEERTGGYETVNMNPETESCGVGLQPGALSIKQYQTAASSQPQYFSSPDIHECIEHVLIASDDVSLKQRS
jgi:hypothetical protein